MIPVGQALLAGVMVEWLLLATYFCWRYLLRRRSQSLIIAFGCLGWVLIASNQPSRVQHPTATAWALAAAAVVGLVGLLVVLHHEAQQSRPFR